MVNSKLGKKMIKKSLIVAGLLLAGTSAVAKDTAKYYIGIGVSNGSGIFTATDDYGNSITNDYDSSSIPIKIGYMLENNNRFELLSSFTTLYLFSKSNILKYIW